MKSGMQLRRKAGGLAVSGTPMGCPSFIQSPWAQARGWPSHQELTQRLRLCFRALAWVGCSHEQALPPSSVAYPENCWEGPLPGGWGVSWQEICVLSVPCNHPFT